MRWIMIGFLAAALAAGSPAWSASPTAQVRAATPVQQAVIVHLKYDAGMAARLSEVFDLEDKLEAALIDAGLGEFDGDEFGGSEMTFFMYGPDADKIFDAISPLLRANPLAVGGYAIKRYGDVDDQSANEVRATW